MSAPTSGSDSAESEAQSIPPAAQPVPSAPPAVSAPYFPPPVPPQYHYGPPQPVPPRRSVAPLVIASALAALGIAGTIAGFLLYSNERSTANELSQQVSTTGTGSDAQRTAALQAACDFASLMGTYDYTKLDQDFSAVLNASTGSFHQTFSDTIGSMKDVMVRSQVRNTVSDTHCGLVSFTGHTAQVVVVAKQTTANVQSSDPRDVMLSMSMTVEEQADGKWLISDVSMLK